MKWFIASDIHGSAYWCKRMLEARERENAERILLLGDILYHGPRNDLPEAYAPKQVIAMLNCVKDDILCVRGNCDTEVDQMVLEFDIMAEYAVIVENKNFVFATHGHHYSSEHLPMLHKGDILLHGHTHVPACEVHENYIYCNPGSISIPKAGSAHSYMTLEGGEFLWKTLDGEIYKSLKPV